MAEMSMNRVIHGAVRRDLDRFTEALSSFGGERRLEQVSTAWANFQDQLTRHHSSEHRIAWPALRNAGISDDVLTQFDAEHDRMAAALESADQAMRSLRGTPSTEHVKAASEAMATLRATATEHLDHEEAELEPFLSEHAHTPEMKAMGRAFAREYTPPESGTFFAWLQDGASSDELVGLRQNVPRTVVAIIGRVFGGKYRRTIAPAWQGHRSS
ncbi:MAG TPA: hemerythrin domain-containing protein [Streptosporangiaceae bacterium]|nr:hemerythrin domain-containing protein [Streptosporangiaceae bacterium]